jgi:hypothetical protein
LDDQDEEDNLRSLRRLSVKLISDLVEKCGDQAIQAILIVTEKFLMNHNASHTIAMMTELFKKFNLDDFKSSYMMEINKEKLLSFVVTSNFDSDHKSHIWRKREIGLHMLG